MLCYAILHCYVMLCYTVILYYVMLCYIILFLLYYIILYYITIHFIIFYHILLCYIILSGGPLPQGHRRPRRGAGVLQGAARRAADELGVAYLNILSKSIVEDLQSFEHTGSSFDSILDSSNSFGYFLRPSFALGGGSFPEPCDAEWAWCHRLSEFRARVGQAHADWVEELGQEQPTYTSTT